MKISTKKERAYIHAGNAVWGDAKKASARYENEENFFANRIMTRNFLISCDEAKHQRNLNTLVIGGPGTGKTFSYALPNIMQCNTSFVIFDMRGEMLAATGNILKEAGYKVNVLNLHDFGQSDGYNPFRYLRSESDVIKLAANICASTKGKSADPFWDEAAEMLLKALIFYVHLEAAPEDKNFTAVAELLRSAEAYGYASSHGQHRLLRATSKLEDLFINLEARKPDHIALKFWKGYDQGPADTKRSIQITLSVKLEKFNTECIRKLTMTDGLEIDKIGEEKTALFVVPSFFDRSYSFIIRILYMQLFQSLSRGQNHIPIHFIMEEFASMAIPDDFPEVLSAMRGCGASASIILQNVAQLKALFGEQWESIAGSCDEFIYFGCSDMGSLRYVSGLLGSDESLAERVRYLDCSECILFVRGEKPIIDGKYDIRLHPNFMNAKGVEAGKK